MIDHVFTVPEEDEGLRLDVFLSLRADGLALTRSYIQKLIAGGAVTVNGHAAGKNDRLRRGDAVAAVLEPPQPLDAAPENIPLDIVYEDSDLIVINKPHGMVVHPAPGNSGGTMVNALLYHCAGSLSGINGALRPGIVHRIDKDTSGLLVAAKNDAAHAGLARQMENHSITREYAAIVHGVPKPPEGTIDQPLRRDPVHRKRYSVAPPGTERARRAVTHYEVLEVLGRFAHIKCRLETGRTHQIRVHLAWLGHPVAGDPVYGPKMPAGGLKGQLLHAGKLGFIHPVSGQALEFMVPPPQIFLLFLDQLRGDDTWQN